MTERIHNITRAVCRQADGSRTDGGKITQLPSPVMSPDVNLAAIDHSEVASDVDGFVARLFLTDYRKALSRATIVISNFHRNEAISFESKERLVIEYSTRLDKNRTNIQDEINVLLYLEHESLPPLDLNHNHNYKCEDMHYFG